jgi:hypothetical protein
MLLPNFIHGKHREVKRRCEKLGKTVASRQHYLEVMLSMGMRDTAADSGDLLVLHGPSPLLSKAECYQLYFPLRMIWWNHAAGKTSSQLIDDIFDESLKTAWGTLLLTPNPACWDWFDTDDRRRAFLRALFAHWDEIHSVGPRFSDGGYDVAPLLKRNTMIQPAIMMLRGMADAEGARTDWPTFFHQLRSKGDL